MKGVDLLVARGVSRSFGGVAALADVGLSLADGEILGLIGPNGAGKTTLFNIISGLLKLDRGAISFRGRDITRFPPHRITASGIARTFQNVRLFPAMTVVENVMLGRHARMRSGLISALVKLPSERREERETEDFCMDILDGLGMADRAREPAANLAFGKMRLLEIARALASGPALLLLDEPAAGLNHSETDRLAQTIEGIRGRGISIIVVEHDMRLVMEISDRVVVLNQGGKIADGPPREVQNDPAVITAYLGGPSSGPSQKPAGREQ